jgi:hypothetical protein
MSDDASARLGLPYLAAGQLQKHVTLNEVLTRLDALVQSGAVSRSTAAQPAAPADGALYILPASPTGAVWASRASGELMRFEAGAWSAVPVPDGALIWVADEDIVAVRDGGGWVALGQRLGAVQGLTRLGLNTTADAANPFAARINKALWTAINVGDGGDGDLRMTFNKETAADVASLLFQSGYGGRAELGLIGDDDLTLKVSADGATWRAALTVDRTTGAASFPTGCGRVETAVLSSGATWAVPVWARRIEAVVVGGGGGGGSGAAGASGASRFGGGGGGAGGVCTAAWAVGDLAASLTVTVGGAGTAGASVSSGTGTTGGTGGISAIASGGVTLISAPGGGGGQGGGASSGTGGAGGAGFPASNGGGAGSVTATSGAGAALTRPDASGGGGAGGGLDAANTVRAGGAGGAGGSLTTPANGGAGGSGTTGSAGTAASTPARSWAAGGGGGGGASITTGHAGGAGAAGAGGGGGGAGVTTSGAGGAGGAGLVRLTAIG